MKLPEWDYKYQKGKSVISFDTKIIPIRSPIKLVIFNEITIEAMERKVHIQEAGVNK